MLLAGLLFAALALFDCWFTEHRLVVLGPIAELNPTFGFLARHFGVVSAILLMVLVPSGIVLGLSFGAGWDNLLLFALGWRMCMFLGQLKTLEIEDKFLKQLEAGRKKQPPPES